jgi:hypothetical protein
VHDVLTLLVDAVGSGLDRHRTGHMMLLLLLLLLRTR